MNYKKDKILAIVSVTLVVFLIMGVFLNSNQKGKETEIEQKIEQLEMPDKAIFQEQISSEEVKNYEEKLRNNINKYLMDELNMGYEKADKGNLVLRSLFAISGGEVILDNESSHEDRLNFLKLFSYDIKTVSGYMLEEEGEKSVHIMTQIHTYYNGEEVENPAPYVKFFMDAEGNITGGTFYGTI